MKLNDLANTIYIPLEKLLNYALNPENPVGSHKAKVFASALGFTQSNYEELVKQIDQLAPITEARFKQQDEHGQHYTVDIEVAGLNGRAVVRTGWLIAPNSNVAKLTTLYVRKKK
jgi:hypothetical protein